MDQKKQSGFSLFPQPPTPPARRSRARTRSSSGGSGKLVKNRPTPTRGHGRKLSTTVLDRSTPPGLIPAPLQIRKASEEVPPLPALLPPLPPFTPLHSRPGHTTPPKTPESAPPRLPAIPQSSPFSPLPRTPTRNGHVRLKTRTVADFIELDAGGRKRASSRLSQWLDLEDGEIDRRRLSRYLGSVLDNTFEIPTFESGSRDSIALLRRASRAELESLVEQCECPPTAIICHCSSSPEFERFRSWSSHKQNASISSTACLLGIPRARFQSAFFHIPEPTITELPSPPGLAFDAEDNNSESGDWTVPRTPSKDDVFCTPSITSRSYPDKYIISSPPSSTSTPSRFQSFSRPFRPDSTYRCMNTDDSVPSTPSRSQSRSTDGKHGYLTSISTMSSFDFDFDAKSRRQSLLRQRQAELQTLPLLPSEKEQSSHFRTDSNESVASQASHFELNTATATVAMSSSSIKPVLITNTPKGVKTPSSTPHLQSPTSPSASTQTSTSSVSIPDYWRQFDAGARARSRSTTLASTATAESAAFSALLTMPLLSPKLAPSTDSPVPGNAFAQRSNTSATMPALNSKTETRRSPSGLPVVGSDQALGRSNTTPHATTFTSQISPHNTPLVIHGNTHVQAHTEAMARLRAYMNGLEDTAAASTSTEAKTGLGLMTEGHTSRRQKSYLYTDEKMVGRDDSGVFGRASVIGANFGGMPGRREFSEPQFYRLNEMDMMASGSSVAGNVRPARAGN